MSDFCTPISLGRICARIKKTHKNILQAIQLHKNLFSRSVPHCSPLLILPTLDSQHLLQARIISFQIPDQNIPFYMLHTQSSYRRTKSPSAVIIPSFIPFYFPRPLFKSKIYYIMRKKHLCTFYDAEASLKRLL